MLELDARPTDTLADAPSVELRPLRPGDWDAVAEIYWDGMRDGLATFQTEVPPWADWDLFEEDRGVAQVPGSLAEALDALERDHEFLTAGGVFSDELIHTWIDYKRENEVDVVRLRPHPAEFSLYFDC